MKEGDKVDLIIGKESPLGFSVLINEEYEGLLYRNEIFQDLEEGQRVKGYIKKLREDDKIDVSLSPQGFKNIIDDISNRLLLVLESNKGVLQLTDKSSPEDIKTQLQISKKNFKKAIGNLYKQKKIRIAEDGIYLLE